MTERDHADGRPDFLARWSAEWADAQDPDHLAGDNLTAWRRRWLGFPGADEERLAALETRIGRRLPPSYRSFLAVTDGWPNAGNFVRRLAGTAEVAPPGDADAERYTEYDGYLWADDDPTEEMIHRSRMWHRALRLDAEADAGILMLDPDDVGPDGDCAPPAAPAGRCAGMGDVRPLR